MNEKQSILLGSVAYRDNDPFVFIAAKTPEAFEKSARECIEEEIKYSDEIKEDILEDLLVYGYSEEDVSTVCEQMPSDTLTEFRAWLNDDSCTDAFVWA
jgi:hypothetical protein